MSAAVALEPGMKDTPAGSPVVEDSVTHSLVRDIQLASGRTLALITLHNGTDRPATFGPAGLTELQTVLGVLAARAGAGQIHAVGVNGRGGVFAAGADLSVFQRFASAAHVAQFAQHGHQVFSALADLPVPSFCFVNGLALGGGLELALHAGYRTVSQRAGALGLPEVSLGLVPGWGGTFLLPHLIGINQALDVVLWNPLRQNRTLTPQQALEQGIVDVEFPAVCFLEDSLRWADAVLDGQISIQRPHSRAAAPDIWQASIDAARQKLDARTGPVPKAPWVALDLLSAAAAGDRDGCFRAENSAIADLAGGDQFAASTYALDLTRRRGRRPAGAPDPALAIPVAKIGVIGAGLMARQFALLFLRRLQVPVLISDLDQDRVDAAVSAIHAELDQLLAGGRIDSDEAGRLRTLVSGTTDLTDYAGCTVVIEAVFEDLTVKQQVLSAVERVVGPDTILATNTSSLSLQQIGQALTRPHRLVGFHFFNPVAVMPLIEIVRAPLTDDASVATAFALAKGLKKTAVLTTDTPGFVVNRLLAIVFGEAVHALDQGTPVAEVEQAFGTLCLPMTPFQLIDMVGWKIAAHVQDTMAGAFPNRFFRSDNLHRVADLAQAVVKDRSGRIIDWTPAAREVLTVGTTPMSTEQILRRVQDSLATEIHLMLTSGVVSDARDIDLCMILGGRWPALNGGITPYLDREHVSERVFGDTFHHPPITGTATASPTITAGAS